MATITSASFVKSANQNEYCPEMDRPEYAFIGRSNVGKSTLINTMCHRKQLAKTSDKPGKTVLMNYFAVESTHEDTSKHARYIVDLPGYGYAKVSKDKRANRGVMIGDYLTQRESLKHTFVLIDSRLTPQEIDLGFVEWMVEQNIPFSLVFTKSDKSTQKVVSAHVKLFMTQVSTITPNEIAYYITSSSKKHSITPIIDMIHTSTV